MDEIRNRDVNCQNCNNVLASFVDGNFIYSPAEITTSEDGISDDETLITLICQKCTCVCQVIV